LAPSLDHVGCLGADLDVVTRAARVLYAAWDDGPMPRRRPVLGIPEGPYLERAHAGTLDWFESVRRALVDAGYECRHVRVMADYDAVCERQQVILSVEAARVHAAWFEQYEPRYGSKTADLIRRGQTIANDQLEAALRERDGFRDGLRRTMIDSGIDAWICPSTTGPAPYGLDSTGDPVMNLPWTQAGFPAINLPAGTHPSGLPMGLQVVGDWYRDEALLAYASQIQGSLDRI
jgi:Asp-tRNA(Asn)/Glu-tRNA(Gln) amidotransferase A subunit family amidase